MLHLAEKLQKERKRERDIASVHIFLQLGTLLPMLQGQICLDIFEPGRKKLQLMIFQIRIETFSESNCFLLLQVFIEWRHLVVLKQTSEKMNEKSCHRLLQNSFSTWQDGCQYAVENRSPSSLSPVTVLSGLSQDSAFVSE